jgi:gliding motility-associated-like protein
MKIFKTILTLLFITSITHNAYSHSVQVGYCTNCNGDVRIWVEHWHGAEDPNGTTMTLNVTVNGVMTSYTGVPNTSVLNTTTNNLPCGSAMTIFGSCPGEANTYNDWVAYDFPSLPTNVPIIITVVVGNTVFTEDGCGMYPASTGIIIIPPPPSYTDVFECVDDNGIVGSIPTSTNSTWTNDNPGIGLPASGTGNIPAFSPPASPAGHVANITVSNSCGSSSFVLTVRPAPEADFGTSGIPGDPLCLGENSIFTDNSSSVLNSNLTDWEWDFGDGSPPDNTSNPTHVYAQPGQYTVVLSVIDANTCTDDFTFDVFISPIPVADFSLDSLCLGSNSAIGDLSTVDNTNGDNISAWLWDFGDGQTSTAANPTHQYGSENLYDVSLTVTSNNGCEHSVTKTTAIYPLPAPDFSATEECLYFANQFTDESTVSNANTSNTNVAWDWDFGDGNTGNTQNISHTYGAPGVYNAELNVTTDHGCEAFVTLPITVFELPIPNFDFTNACDNEDVLLESTSNANATGNLIYDWDVDNDNILDYSADPVNHTYNNDGFHDVRLIVENSNGCRDTVVRTVTVYSLPNTDFDVDAVCEDATTSFTNTSTIVPVDNDVVNQYDWDFGNGSSSTDENPTLAYGAENVYQAELVITTNYGCKDSITLPVEVYPLPVPDFSVTEECLAFANQFTDESTISNDYTTNTNVAWEWDFGDGNTVNTQNASHTYGAQGVYNTELNVTSNHGCEASVVFPVTVLELPIANFDFTNACDDADVLLASTSTANASGNLDFFWDVDNNSSTDYTSNAVAHTYNNDGFHDVRLIVENSKGCRDTISQEITVYALPNADFIADAVCEDTTTTFTNNSTIVPVDNDVINQYEWDFGDGNTSSIENPTVDYGVENVYNAQLIITTNYGCKDTLTSNVSVYPLPVIDFTPTEVCLEFDTHFQDQSTVSNDHTSNQNVAWDWDFADGNTANIQNPIHTYLTDGVFNTVLIVTTNHDCVASKTIAVTVYPKPMASFVGVDLEGCSPVCPTISSTSTINNPSTIVDYHWELSDGSFYEGSSPILSDCFYNETGNDITYGLTLTVTSGKGCVNNHFEPNYIVVNHNPVANFYFTPDNPDVIDPVVDFHNTSLYADSYSWTFGNHSQSSETNPVVEFPPDSMSYNTELIAYTDKGCSDTVWTVVRILDRLIFYIPNTFTPDNDNFNETFKPIFTSGFDPQSYNLYIFNRWGEMIFESHDTNFGWDGTYGVSNSKKVKDATYIWKVDFKTSMNDERKAFTGHVNLLK